MSNPKQRYLKHFEKLSFAISESVKLHEQNPSIPIAKFVYEKDGRTPLFQLEGLARIDNKIGKNPEIAESRLINYKTLEDALGSYDYWSVLIKQNANWKFSQEIENFLIEQANLALSNIEKILIEQQWLVKISENKYQYSNKHIQQFEKETLNEEWYKPSKEKKELLKFFAKVAIKIHKSIKENELDLNLVEDGIHEFRRKLRWLGIYSSSLCGKVIINEQKKSDALFSYVTDFNRNFVFNKLPENSQETDNVYFLQGGFYAMSELIKKIGDLKDLGLSTEEMTKIGTKFGMNPDEIRQKLGKDYMEHSELVGKAKEIVNHYLFQEKILIHIAEFFENQAD